MAGRAFEALRLPVGFWARPDVADALRSRDIGRLFGLVQSHTGASQTTIGIAVGMTQGQISPILNGTRRVTTIDVLERLADGLAMPDPARVLVGLAPRRVPVARPEPAQPAADHDTELARALSYPATADEGAGTAAGLVRVDLDAPDAAAAAPVDVNAWHRTSLAWLVTDPAPATARETVAPRVGRSDIDAVRATTQIFARLDNSFGGGHGRRALIQYLGSDAAHLLTGSYTEATGHALFSAVAEATLLAAWMSYDAGLHGLAQRYFVQALRLAEAGADRLLAASVLDAMSHQATFLGKYTDAARLAQAARSGTRTIATPTLTAHFHAMEARAMARLGDARACDHALSEAARLFERRNPDDDPEWIRYFDHAELAAELGHCFRDLARPLDATTHAAQSIAAADGGYPRSDFFATMLLADAHLSAGDDEQAYHVAMRALHLGEGLKSARCVAYLRQFRAGLHRRTGSRAARDFLDQAADSALWQRAFPTQ